MRTSRRTKRSTTKSMPAPQKSTYGPTSEGRMACLAMAALCRAFSTRNHRGATCYQVNWQRSHTELGLRSSGGSERSACCSRLSRSPWQWSSSLCPRARNHVAYDVRWLAVPGIFSALYGLLGCFTPASRRLGMILCFTAVIFTVLVLFVDHYSLLVGYERWCERGMPQRWTR